MKGTKKSSHSFRYVVVDVAGGDAVVADGDVGVFVAAVGDVAFVADVAGRYCY